MGIEFRPVTGNELERLKKALGANAESGEAIRMNPRDTSFLGGDGDLGDMHTEEVIASIKAIPCHYTDAIDSEQYLLERSGKPPLSFTGRLIASETGCRHNGRERSRWTDVWLYRVDSADQYVLRVEFETCWQGEVGDKSAVVIKTAADADMAVSMLDPRKRASSIGFPQHPQYVEKQQRMLEQLLDDYKERIGTVLLAAGDAFAEKVEGAINES